MITSRPAGDAVVPGHARPQNECPWPRPFPRGFRQCPAYVARAFVPVDTNERPLNPTITCAHLVGHPLPDRVGGWYAACALGDAAARLRWVSQAAGLPEDLLKAGEPAGPS
jgi:hypothetical protein